MTGRLVEFKHGVINANGIFVRSDVALPFPGDMVSVFSEESGKVFDAEVTRVNWALNTYDIKMRVE